MASSDVTVAPAHSRALAATGALERVAWLSVLRVMLGALFVSVFFENLNKHLYEAKGYAALIGNYRAEGTAPGAWKDVEKFIADHGSFFAPVQAVFELSLGVLLVLGIGTGVGALVMAGPPTPPWVSPPAPPARGGGDPRPGGGAGRGGVSPPAPPARTPPPAPGRPAPA